MNIETIPSAQSLLREQAVFSQREAHDIVLADRVITPFVKAVIGEGFIDKRHPGGCSILSKCNICRNGYVFTFIKDGKEINLCPHCRDIADKREKIR